MLLHCMGHATPIGVPGTPVLHTATPVGRVKISDVLLVPPPPFTVRTLIRHRPEAWTARQPAIS